jgi:hypothetical protein
MTGDLSLANVLDPSEKILELLYGFLAEIREKIL